jgi:Protein of unknown function (DUF2892)
MVRFFRLALHMLLSGQKTSGNIRPGVEMGDAMNVERWIRVIAGTFVLVSLGLGWYVSPWFLLFTAFVGLNLFQAGWTNWCLMEKILIKLDVPERQGE